MLMTRFFAGIFLVSTTVPGAAQVFGQDYPNRTIRIVTGPAGGGQDFTARLIALGLTGSLGPAVM